MTRTRADVWNSTRAEGDWPAVLAAYERAVGMMRDVDPPTGKPVDPLGWRFQAAIHGLADASGRPDLGNALWCNCQHGSWYFLPWHRMYLAAFERIVQHSLEDEEWSLPYWYSIDPDDPTKAVLPPAFLDRTLDDNNLQTEERSEHVKAGLPFHGDIDFGALAGAVLDALAAPVFATPSGGPATFGGGERASLSFDGGERGALENVPHGLVHALVGNDYDQFGLVREGWMGSFYTAGLDPVFWLHHCNIDRLWEVWRRLDPAHEASLHDPAFLDTTFTFPDPVHGSVTWSVEEALDTATFGYVYESYDPPSVLAPPPGDGTRRLQEEAAVPRSLPPQVLGATEDVALDSAEPVVVAMEPPPRTRGAAQDAAQDAPASRAYLRVEGVTGTNAAPLYGVYVNVPAGEDPRQHPELRAGSFATFGLRETSRSDAQHDAEGLTAVFDVTAVRDRLAAEDRWDDGRVDIRFTAEVPGGGPGGEPGVAAPEGDAAAASRRPDVRARRIAVVVD